jgi:hypothetical protein
MKDEGNANSSFILHPSSFLPLGYCIGHDQYFKRDDCGIIYQMNVVPDRQRGLIGATLVKAMFERAAYGCRLFCCWCAQDIEANYFWESLGFVPLAFRSGSRGKGKGGRVHIFWQRRIRAGDTTTPYWFPAQTSSGAIREDRLVLPIPPHVHWRDAMPLIFPSAQAALPDSADSAASAPRRGATGSNGGPTKKLAVQPRPKVAALRGVWFGSAPSTAGPPHAEPTAAPKPRVRAKNDPKLIAAARELRDRWLEQVNADGAGRIEARQGKYDVSRQLQPPASDAPQAMPRKILSAA